MEYKDKKQSVSIHLFVITELSSDFEFNDATVKLKLSYCTYDK